MKKKYAVIYLAAGNSRRFGSNKLLYLIEGKPMYLHVLERLIYFGEKHKEWEVLVVTQYREILENVQKLQEEGFAVSAVFSPESAQGASVSIRAGLTAAGEKEACVFCVADQPYLTEHTVESFLTFMEESGKEIGCVSWNGKSGNPVWFSNKFFPELMELSEDQGGKKVLKRHREEAVYFDLDEQKELEDIDELGYQN